MTTKKMGAQENECQIFQNFKCVITILIKFDIHNSQTSWEIFFGVTTDDLLHLQPLKNVKQRMQNSLSYSAFLVLSTEN